MENPWKVIRAGVVASTQDAARDLPAWTAVVAVAQTAGRGRLGRRWEARPGTSLLASFVVPFHPLAPIAAGVALARAAGPAARLKWPNDVLLDGAKAAGILAESRGDRVVIGIGANTGWAPPGAAMLGGSPDDLLARLLIQLPPALDLDRAALLDSWRSRSATLGTLVRVELGGTVVEGIAEDIDGDGSLVVAGRSVAAGDVVHLRPAPAPPGPAGAAARPPGP